jgi:hypothetical protein
VPFEFARGDEVGFVQVFPVIRLTGDCQGVRPFPVDDGPVADLKRGEVAIGHKNRQQRRGEIIQGPSRGGSRLCVGRRWAAGKFHARFLRHQVFETPARVKQTPLQ